MIMVLNCLAVLLLSLTPAGQSARDLPGFSAIAKDPGLRGLLLKGRAEEFQAAVESALIEDLARNLGSGSKRSRSAGAAKVGEAIHAREDRQGALGTLKSAISVIAFVTELQALGPAQAMSEALRWVEDGIIRRSGLKPDLFPAYFQVISRPGRSRLNKGDLRALDHDLGRSVGLVEASYARIRAGLSENFF